MQDLLDMFYVEGDMMQTVCKMTVLFVLLIVMLDIIYVLKSSIRSSGF